MEETRIENHLPNLADFEKLGTVSKNYVPEGFDTAEDYLEDLRETYSLDIEADRWNREQALEDKKFAAGEQWDPIVLQQRVGLPCLVINTIPQFIAQIVGDWRQIRNGIKVLPGEDGDVDVAAIRSDLIRAIETQSRADRVYNNAFESMAQCGDGAFQVCVEYTNEDVFDQEIRIKPIDDALAVVWDRLSIDPTGKDATHCFVTDIIPKKDFKKQWPNAKITELDGKEYRRAMTDGWCDTDTIKITAHWRMLIRKRLLALFQDGSVRFIDDGNQIEKLVSDHGQIIKTRLSDCKYAEMHLTTGYDILSGPFTYRLNRLPVIRMTGRTTNVGGRRIRDGVVRTMKDPVRMKNFWRSVAAEQLGYAPKAQWIAPESAVEGREEDFRRTHLSRDPLLIYNDGAEAPPQRLGPPPIEAALLNQSQINTQDMKDVSGIHDASLGIRSNETSGRAIMARQREGDVASLVFYDNGNAAVLECGDVINQLIGQIYDNVRVIRIVGEDETVRHLKINDEFDPTSPNIAVGKYDTAITTGPSYTTRRVEAAEAMMQAVQVWPQLIQIAGDIIAKAQDWPGADELAERLRKTIDPKLLEGERGPDGQPIQAGPQIPPEIQQMIMQGQEVIQKQGAELQKLQTDRSVELAKLEVDRYNAETQRLKVVTQSNDRMASLSVKSSNLPAGQEAIGKLSDLNGR